MATMTQTRRTARRESFGADPVAGVAGAAEQERLALQAQVWEPAAEAMIAQIGVANGWRCIDLGCGARGILRPLSAASGMLGTVIGIDHDAAAMADGRAWANENALHNVWLFEDDAMRTQLPRGCYDLVHARFLFAPIGNDDVLLKEMIDLTRPGGIVAIQEPDASSWNCHPRRAGWEALKPAIGRAFRAGGGDFDAGQRAYSMLAKAGLEDVQVRAHVIALPPGHEYRHLPSQFANSLRQRILDGGLLSERQLDAAVADCTAAANDAGTVWTTFTLMQAWGRKPR